MTPAAGVAALIARWAHFYSDRKAVSAGVTYIHLAGILLGGGMAIAADRASLQLVPASEPDLPRELARLRAVHRVVLAGLAITITSGLAILLSDLDTYLSSVLYWTKMALVAALLFNGYLRLRAEQRLERGEDAWRRFRVTSALSLVLLFGILLAGAFLSTIS